MQTGCDVAYKTLVYSQDFSLVLDFLMIRAPNRINTHADVRKKTISAAYTTAMSGLSSPVKCDFGAAPIPGSTDQSG